MNNKITKALAIVERGIVPYQPISAQQPLPAQQQIMQQRPPIIETRQAPTVAVFDLPRFCALHNKPYIARYIGNGRGYDYAQSIRVTESLYRGQYDDNDVRQEFNGSHLQYEHCPWCGSYSDDWKGPIHCNACNRFFCYGTTARNYFRCPCGHHGKLHMSWHNDSGVVPSYRQFGSGGS